VTDPRHGARSALIILFAINLLNFFDRNMFGAVARAGCPRDSRRDAGATSASEEGSLCG